MAPLSLFRFTGKIGRLPYALASLAAFFSQHLVIAGIARAMGAPVNLDAWFALLPYRALATLSHVSLWFGPSLQRPAIPNTTAPLRVFYAPIPLISCRGIASWLSAER